MLSRLLALATSSLVSLGLMGFVPAAGQYDDPPPPAKKKGGKAGPEQDLRKAYGLLYRLRAEGRSAGRSEGRIRDWTDRAVQFYRDGLKAHEDGDPRLAHEYGAVAHDLARATDHARHAMLFDRADESLPTPPGDAGFEPVGRERIRSDLRRIEERIGDFSEPTERTRGSRFYLDAARDLHAAAKRDVDGERFERADELAHAADAMIHVLDHLGHAADESPRPEPRPIARKKERERPREKAKLDREPKKERFGDLLPPAPRD
jgi:hypothetical protein